MAVDPNFGTTSRSTASGSRPISPLPQSLYPPHQLTKPCDHDHDPSSHHPFLYPVSSSGRGFIPKDLRRFSSTDLYSHMPSLNHPLHITTPPNLHYPRLLASPPIEGVPVSAHPKMAPRSAVSNSNGYKDTSTRERSRDDAFSVVRDRKVRITENASLYALCRSWLRNGINEESQPQQKDVMKALPKPLPASMVASYMSNKKQDEKDEDDQEENEESLEHLSPQDLLKRHIKRAKKVRARLREERWQRIKKYRSRLNLLLSPPVEQFRNDTAPGN